VNQSVTSPSLPVSPQSDGKLLKASLDTGVINKFKKFLLDNVAPKDVMKAEFFCEQLESTDSLRRVVVESYEALQKEKGCGNTPDHWVFSHSLGLGLGLACGLPSPRQQLDVDWLMFVLDSEVTARKAAGTRPGMGIDSKLSEWRSDTAFVENLINGMNPMVIKKARSMEELPSEMRGLQTKLMGRSVTVTELLRQRKLFLADYSVLNSISVHSPLYAPQVLLGLQDGQLHLLAIRLASASIQSTHLLTPSSPSNRWAFAKLHVALADVQVHQFVHHRPLHLMMETVAIANNNWLKNHVIGNLLKPHFQGTILINFVGKHKMLDPELSFVDKNYAVGLNGATELLKTHLNFTRLDFPQQMESRGFPEDKRDGLTDFHYRDDGFKLWNILGEFVVGVVRAAYNDDAGVINDWRLQSWATAIAEPRQGNLPAFPRHIDTRHQLARLLTTLVFSASAHHHVLNGLQLEYSDPPYYPTVLRDWMPGGDQDLDISFIKKSLNFIKSRPTINVLERRTICSLDKGTGSALVGHPFDGIKNKLHRDLAALSETISARSQSSLTQVSLDPRQIPCSVDV